MAAEFDSISSVGSLSTSRLIFDGCTRLLQWRRHFVGSLFALGMVLTLPGMVRADGIEMGERSRMAGFVPADQIESAAAQQYQQLLHEAKAQNALFPNDHPQVQRLRAISDRIIRYTDSPNLKSTSRAQQWKWEVNLIKSKQINAFCMPGGKIAFYSGILEQLKLTDDEVAIVMGHEVAHALREHARERMGKSTATNGLIELGSALLGLGNAGRQIAGFGGQLLSLRFSREDESEADKVGLDLAARAGYNPGAGVSLWKKMSAASKGAPPQWLSTHPAGASRIQKIEENLPQVQPLYEQAEKPPKRFEPLGA